jgi:hypothetical protein
LSLGRRVFRFQDAQLMAEDEDLKFLRVAVAASTG